MVARVSVLGPRSYAMAALQPSRAARAAFCGPQPPSAALKKPAWASVCVTLELYSQLRPRKRQSGRCAPPGLLRGLHASYVRGAAFDWAPRGLARARAATLHASRRDSLRCVDAVGGCQHAIAAAEATTRERIHHISWNGPGRYVRRVTGPFAGFATGAPATTPTRAQ